MFGYGPIPQQDEKVETKAVVGSAHMGEANANDWRPGVPGADGLIWEWRRRFPQMLWVGDEARGLSLVSLSTRGYSTREGDPTVRLAREGEALALSYRFITHNVPLNKPRRMQFALQIMPPKPVAIEARFSASKRG